MKNLLKIITAAFIIFSLISCSTTTPITATGNPLGKKVGEAKYGVVLCIFPLNKGDASITKAAKNGGITKISTIDKKIYYPVSPLLGIFYYEVSTVVTGD